MMRLPFADAAAELVSQGWHVFPLAPLTKIPAIAKAAGGRGVHDATDNDATITRWGAIYPAANIGIATGERSGVLVVDVDPRNGGLDTLARLKSEGCRFPEAPTVRTANRGWHWYGAWQPGLKSGAHRLGPGLDLKTCGGYVVGPPSVIGSSASGVGGAYSWTIAPSPRAALPELPSWAVERLNPPPKLARGPLPPQRSADGANAANDEVRADDEAAARRSLEGAARKVAAAAQGTRNDLLNWAAYRCGELVKLDKLSEAIVVERLTTAAANAGLDDREIARTIASGLGAALGRRLEVSP